METRHKALFQITVWKTILNQKSLIEDTTKTSVVGTTHVAQNLTNFKDNFHHSLRHFEETQYCYDSNFNPAVNFKTFFVTK